MATPLKLGDNPWKVTAIADEGGELEPVIEGTAPDIHFDDDQVSGDGSCNHYSGPYDTPGGDDLDFGELVTTMMACLDVVMDQEQLFLYALDSVDSYSIAGTVLEMRSSGEVVALFEAIPTSLANTEWRLVGLNDGKQAVVSVLADSEISATSTEDGTLAGSSGCNTYRATWEAEGESIHIGPAMGTKKMCAGEGVMDQEARYLEVLALVRSFRMDATSLEMLDDEGSRQLQFVRAKE